MNKIKNFFEDIILDIKNRLFSSKYVIKGKCNRCGECCKSVLFSDENGYIKDIEGFEKLKKRNFVYSYFSPNGVVKGEGEALEGAMMFKCKHLTKNNKCGIYLIRPIFCRDYPTIDRRFIEMGGVMLDKCGFKFEADKPFKSYLK